MIFAKRIRNIVNNLLIDKNQIVHKTSMYLSEIMTMVAQRGKSSTGWFYGFKLHLVINDKDEILSFCLTSGNVDDRNWNVISHLTKEIYGKLFADRGYLSKKCSKNSSKEIYLSYKT